MTKMMPCPECGSDDVFVDSSGSQEITVVECDCGHRFQSGCYEENIARYWNRHVRAYLSSPPQACT